MCVIITLILSIIIIRETVYPIKSVTEKLKEISQSNGDFTQRIGYESKDEVGELSGSFDLFMDKLQSIIKEVYLSAETISSLSVNLNQATTITILHKSLFHIPSKSKIILFFGKKSKFFN